MIRKKEKSDDRKQVLVRYRLDENDRVSFIDPSCDEMPLILFGRIMEAIAQVEEEWNQHIDNKKQSGK